MSVPHTGRLIAEVNGQRCEFNGDVWKCDDAALAAELNEATETSPKHHSNIEELARHVLYKAGYEQRSKILEWRGDRWKTDLPEGAID